MEIASPLAFQSHVRGGKKRAFACSPSFVDPHGSAVPTSHEELMHDHTTNSMESEGSFFTSHQAFKRRRFHANEGGSPVFSTSFSSPFGQMQGMVPSAAKGGVFGKRSRSERDEAVDSHWNQDFAKPHLVSDLQKVVEQQASEIESLKSEKASVENALSQTKDALEKTSNENKILKRAVTIQQERQNHAVAEIEAAYKYKIEAEDRIKKLEHMNISLRYRLQSMDASSTHDFMGFQPRPPDVF